MFGNFLTYNIDFGQLEAYVHGLRASLITTEEYDNLTQCETLEDLKVGLSTSDYGNFLQNVSSLNPSIIVEKAREKLVKEVNEIRFNAIEPLAKFIDFVTYEYMINNVLKLIQAVRNGRGALDLLYKCHPLGMFSKIQVITKLENVKEMYELVLVDSPIGKFFTKSGVSEKDFDELSTTHIKSLLYKNYLESYYDFCQNLGGTTAEVMGEILEFEADRCVLTVTRQSCKSKELRKDQRLKLFPNFGKLLTFHEELSETEDDRQIQELLKKKNITEFAEMFEKMEESSGRVSLENQMSKREVFLNKLSFTNQFHFGIFYSIIKLKEQEIQNLMWIGECLHQGMKQRINEFIPIYSVHGFDTNTK